MTDRSGQNATLSPTQELAVAALVEGHSVTDAAAVAGVTRQTVHRWLAGDFFFRAELNRQRQEIRDAYRDRLHQLAGVAIGTVEEAVGKGDARVALALLRDLGVLSLPAIGSSNPDELREAAEIEELQRQTMHQLSRDLAGAGM